MATRFFRGRSTIGVRDVTASIAFYERAVGFEVVVTMGDPPNFALIGSSGTGLGLVETARPSIADFVCCYFDIEGVEELHQRCLDAGTTITSPLTRQPWGNYDFVIADADGHQVAFGEVPPEPAP